MIDDRMQQEPFIVTIDDQEGGFEMVFWSESYKDAKKFYDELDQEAWQEYPDKQGRHKRMWVVCASSESKGLRTDSK